MKKKWIKLFCTLFLLPQFALYASNHGVVINGQLVGNIKQGSSIVKEKKLELKPFEKIDSDVAMDIIIEESSSYSCVIKADDNLLNLVEIVNSGGTLKIRTKGSYQTSSDMKLYIKTKKLNHLKVAGSSNVVLKSIHSDNLFLNIDGSSDIVAKGGAIGSLRIVADGAYDLDLSSLKTKGADIILNGSGEVKVNVSEVLTAKVRDSATLSYRGSPRISTDIRDSGDIEKIN